MFRTHNYRSHGMIYSSLYIGQSLYLVVSRNDRLQINAIFAPPSPKTYVTVLLIIQICRHLISQHFNSLAKEYFEANTNVSFPKKYFNEIFKVKMNENSIDNSVQSFHFKYRSCTTNFCDRRTDRPTGLKQYPPPPRRRIHKYND